MVPIKSYKKIYVEALTFTHSVSLKGGQLMGDVIRTDPTGVFMQSYLRQFKVQLDPGYKIFKKHYQKYKSTMVLCRKLEKLEQIPKALFCYFPFS